MRPNQAHRQEERLILVLLQQLNGLRGRLVIRLIRAVAFVPHSHKHPMRHTRGLPILFRGREYIQVQARIKPLRVRLFTGRIETLRPRGCDVQSVRAGNDIAGDTHVINLPHPRAVPAVLTKVLTEIHLAGAQVSAVHERRSRRRAHQPLAIRTLKHHSFPRQLVNVWRLTHLIAVATEHTRFKIVTDDKEHILDGRLGRNIQGHQK